MCLVSICFRLARRVGLEFRKRSWGIAGQPNHFQSTSSASSSYDYVIVGAGSAGCVLANRLSADPGSTVLLLEAGPKDNTWKIHMPAAMEYNIENDKYNWIYTTEPQENLQNRSIYHPRGRVLGGSSSLNAMIYMRGHALDYDRWDTDGASGWSYADCLPYFKKAETYELGANDYRGDEGPLFVSRGKPDTPLDVAFLDAAVQAGYPLTEDMNGYQQEGFGPMDRTIHKGRRWSTASAYLRPALPRQNLVTETGSLVDRVLFESNKAVGVSYRVGNTTRCARAAKDVILCGGVINSPQLLMLSGIGNANELKELGIPVVSNLPGVGQNLQDHLQVYIQYECTQPVSLHSTLQWQNKILAGVRWFLFKNGPCATSHFESGGFIKSDSHVPHPDIEIQFLPMCLKDVGKSRIQGHGYQLCVEILRPSSRGFVKLRSRDPLQHPFIQPNYLASQKDLQLLNTCVRVARHLVGQKAFDPYRGKELKPGPGCNTDHEVESFIRAFAKTDYHPCGTCKMGADDDPNAVVDSQTRVFGVDNLRVVDASIMPSIISGNLNAPTIMTAEKAADYILGNEMLPKIRPSVY